LFRLEYIIAGDLPVLNNTAQQVGKATIAVGVGGEEGTEDISR